MTMDFGKYIKELLLLHDCVILPGLGGFVANYRPAEFDRARNTVSPPSKHILFNPQLVHNDGLLYAHVSKMENYGYKDVGEMARDYIDGIRKIIDQGMKFLIEGLGYFYLEDEQVKFSEKPGNNFLLESYGLPLLQYREFEKPDTYRSLRPEHQPAGRQKMVRRLAYGTAAAAVLAAMIFIPIRTGYLNQAGIELPSIDSFRSRQKEQVVNPERHTATAESSQSSKTYFLEPEYNIIVGSFGDFANAREFRKQVIAKGYDARILCTEKAAYRVTAGTYTQESEASVELAFVLSDYDDAWVLSN